MDFSQSSVAVWLKSELRLLTSDLGRVGIRGQAPDAVEFLQVKLGKIGVVDDKHVIVVFLVCRHGKIE